MLVVNGYTQVDEIDYKKVFSHVIKYYSIRILMKIVNQYDIELEKMDVTMVFLHGDFEETINMKQFEGFCR